MFLWMPPSGDRAGDVLLADSTIFSTLFGRDESLERFWKKPCDSKVRPRRKERIHDRRSERHARAWMTSRAACCARGRLRTRPRTLVFRIDDRKAGRELMRRVSAVVTSAANPTSPLADTWVSVALTYPGLKALGVPQDSLDSFAWEFRQGMAARAKELGDTGESSPENWEAPLGTPDVHVVLVAVSPDGPRLEAALERAGKAYRELSPGITAIWRQDCHALPTETEPFGFRDGISHPAIEGSGIPGTNPQEQPLKAGEFVLGYPDEMGGIQRTQPEVLGRNGTYVVFRKLHQRVAAFRRYLKANSTSPEEEELLAAKMMGRWRSGAPWRSARSTTIPNWAPTRDATTISSIKTMTRRDSRPPAARTSGGQTRATRPWRA